MPLDQHIEGGHGEGQTRLKIGPAPMHHLLQMADECQHREHRLHEHAVLPLAALTHFEIARIALRGMEAGVAQDDHSPIDLLNQPLNADFRRAKTINIFGSAREAHGYWKTTGRFCSQGIAWCGWSRAASRKIGLWQRLSQCTTIRSGWISPPPRFHEFAIQLFGRSGVKATQLLGQPAIATIGQYSHGGVEIDVESYFPRQTIDVKEIHANPQPVLDAMASSVAYDQRPRTLLGVVGPEQGRVLPSQSRDRQLAQ